MTELEKAVAAIGDADAAILPPKMVIEWAPPTEEMVAGAVAAMLKEQPFLQELFDNGEMILVARAALAGAAAAAQRERA